ncbi:hypothetical protein NHH03_19410 [Stieleria sp. TO1_6]|uniref:hypothetical protein n=1 Tax=Stieleria tagensis TaxID=2956795 RepID=UPI00209B04CC|nr:hypothetical protein [Stieleria tagensis]MCO8123922.1 hypothetical protein [Stieleria tagensis]
MPENRSYASTLSTLFGTGTLVALFSWLGFAHSDLPVPPKTKTASADKALRSDFPTVDGAVSLYASMWEDPFVFADSKLEGLKSKTEIAATIKDKLKDDARLLYLVIPVPEGKQPWDIERRRRRRHAVELALANQGFELPFADRMTYRQVSIKFHFSPRPPADAQSDQDDLDELVTCLTSAVPTKLYKHKTTNDLILANWVLESQLGRRPLDTIRYLLDDVVPDDLKKRSALCLLGPTWSDSFHTLTADAQRYESTDNDFYSGWENGLVVVNYSCTASNQRLGLQPGQQTISIGDAEMKVIHTIGSDERLLQSLKHELGLRGVWPSGESSDSMVLFVEQSSLSYVDGLQEMFFDSDAPKPIVIPYLKGLSTAAEEDASVEDYLDRSVSELETLSRAGPINPRSVRLVGILGSQWEDKEMILCKARPAFPVATFFTTELEARYGGPSVDKHGRNLVVASHYGLRVAGRSDVFGRINSIPQFRDGYQTSCFLGTSILSKAFAQQRLLDSDFMLTYGELPQNLFDIVGRQENKLENRISPAYLNPLVFEIGNYGPIQLRSQAATAESYLPLRQPLGTPSIHERSWLLVVLPICIIMGVVIFNWLATLSSDARDLRRRIIDGFDDTLKGLFAFFSGESSKRAGRTWAYNIAVIIAAVILVVMVISNSTAASEPILIFEGISIWPSIWGLYLVIAFGFAILRNMFPKRDAEEKETDPALERSRFLDWTACKLAACLIIGFYSISYFESGFIAPPARDWIVRWLASVILFIASGCVLLVSCRCLIYSLGSRQTIRDFENHLRTDNLDRIVGHCTDTMHLSIDASKDMIGPAILSLLFIGARWRIWDAWGLDRSWYVLIGAPIVTCFVAAIIVRMTAIDYRNKAIEFLRQQRYDALTGVRQTRHLAPDSLQHSIDEITRLNRGPFGPISNDYLLGAAALIVAVAATGPIGTLLSRLLLYA